MSTDQAAPRRAGLAWLELKVRRRLIRKSGKQAIHTTPCCGSHVARAIRDHPGRSLPAGQIACVFGAARRTPRGGLLPNHANACSNSCVPVLDPMEGLPQDLAVLDTCISAVMDVWRAAPIPDVDSPGVRDRKAALRQDWPALATALDDLAACPDLVTLLSRWLGARRSLGSRVATVRRHRTGSVQGGTRRARVAAVPAPGGGR
jgi:hypothetical protein